MYTSDMIIRAEFFPHHLPSADISGGSVFVTYNFIRLPS